jgi:hypothetical protein
MTTQPAERAASIDKQASSGSTSSSRDPYQLAYVIAAIGTALLAGIVLLAMGRVPVCTCGYVKAWHGITASSENSQHLADWYTFSHIIHGFGFYLLYWLLGGRRRWPLGAGLVLAVALEATWEVVENTPFIIDRYRAQTIALDYFGDSVINSLADIGAMAFGFLLAARWPVWIIVALAVAMEIGVGYWIRDNLTLNILQLVYPSDVVLQWQRG